MCGIIGRISREVGGFSLQEADLMRLRHRGPDDQGVFLDDHISLGHRRLSIIDLSPGGHQPKLSPDDRFVMVYNGEVYNYLEIRSELQQAGRSFQTQSDTEVVLAAYEQWGPTCLQKFRGMFALAIWDRRDRNLFLARDRCGEKPLLYYLDQNQFCFASEFKALVPLLPSDPILDPVAVDSYLSYQYVPEPMTFLQGVLKLPAAHYAVLDLDTWRWSMTEYWSLSGIQPDPRLTDHDIRQELDRAVAMTLRSDVPIGIALSAGIDSAGIAALAARHQNRPLETFSVGYPGRPAYDERAEAKEIAQSLGAHFHEIELPTDKFVDEFQKFVTILDEPVADIAAFGHYAVPQACAAQGIKVLLTGIGGDEVFWGYDWCRMAVAVNENPVFYRCAALAVSPFLNISLAYKALFKLSRTRRFSLPVRDFFRKVLATADHDAPPGQLVFMSASGAPEFSKYLRPNRKFYGPAMTSVDQDHPYQITAMTSEEQHNVPVAVMSLLFKTWLSGNCLTLGDRLSMAVGVESRLPFLDVGLIEKVVAYRQAVPDHHLGQKAILRKILADVLPPKTIQRRKSGFVPPVNAWMNGIIQTYGASLSGGLLQGAGILNKDPGISALAHHPHTFYRLLLLEEWFKQMHDSRRLIQKYEGEKAA